MALCPHSRHSAHDRVHSSPLKALERSSVITELLVSSPSSSACAGALHRSPGHSTLIAYISLFTGWGVSLLPCTRCLQWPLWHRKLYA